MTEQHQSIVIRVLEPDEWELYKSIRLSALREEPQAFTGKYEQSSTQPDTHWQERLAEAKVGNTSWLLFALCKGKPVGIVGGYMSEPGVAMVVAVYVSRANRGQGLARRLMAELLRRLDAAEKVISIRLTVNMTQEPAVRLYKSLGFVVTGEGATTMGNGEVCDEYYMMYK